MRQHATTSTLRNPGRRPASRAAVAVAVGALTLVSACGSSDSGSMPTATPPRYDTAPLTAGATWLGHQVTRGVVHNDQYGIDDYGLSADVALALHDVDAEPKTVQAVSDQLARHVKDYTSPGYGTLTSAGSTAKAAVLAQAVGADPTSYGGQDLVFQLEGTVADSGPSKGRIQDALDTHVKSATDYANVVGQAYAVMALDAAGSDRAGDATGFLVSQQCSGGWFRLDFTRDSGAADQTCDGDKASKPDIDATAFAVRALSAVDSPEASSHVDSAVAWLEKQQAQDGSFGGGSGSATPNSNSTGLAGTALAEAGDTTAAERAAGWVSRHQVADCPKTDRSDVGAIAYDDAALQAAATQGITVKTSDQFRRASAEALPVLQWLPADQATVSPSC